MEMATQTSSTICRLKSPSGTIWTATAMETTATAPLTTSFHLTRLNLPTSMVTVTGTTSAVPGAMLV